MSKCKETGLDYQMLPSFSVKNTRLCFVNDILARTKLHEKTSPLGSNDASFFTEGCANVSINCNNKCSALSEDSKYCCCQTKEGIFSAVVLSENPKHYF